MAAAEVKSPEVAEDEAPMYNPLLTKVYNGDREQLENDISEKLEGPNRSLNRKSALTKLVREKGRRELPNEVSIAGYFLQRYQRKPTDSNDTPGMSVYVATKQGIRTIHAESPEHLPSPKEHGLTAKVFGEKQKWTNLTQVENVIYGSISLRSNKGKTSFSPATDADIGQHLWDMCKEITVIRDGQDAWRAYVAAIFPVGRFENGQLSGNEPILDSNGLAHLRVGLTDQLDRKTGRPQGRAKTFVEITSEAQLKTFLGPYFDDTFLMSENATKELADTLQGQPIIVFGSGTTPNNERLTRVQKERMKASRINIYGGRGTIAPWNPAQ
jgi:hypothetical protein